MSTLDTLLFGVYPYVCMAVFFLGSLLRFDREAYTWRSESSQLLKHGQLRLGANLFHVGILGILGGHLVGLLTPLPLWHALGVTAPAKQLLAIVAGGIAGSLVALGLLVLLHRRLTEPRIRTNTNPMDWIVLLLLLAQVSLGLFSLTVSWHHRDGAEMIKLMQWVQSTAYFHMDGVQYIADADPVFKAHILLGLTIFLVAPFSRLVHAWSGFGTVAYLFRPFQVVRTRR
jgi:nitrate reductase gamma subunit